MNRAGGCRRLAVIVGVVLAGVSPGQETPEILRPGDAMLVRIENLGGGLPAYREIVDREGNIELPFLHVLPAAGKSLTDLAGEMAEAYARAGLSTNVRVHLEYITHFEPPPNRADLVRIEDPRQPVSAIPPPRPPPPPPPYIDTQPLKQ